MSDLIPDVNELSLRKLRLTFTDYDGNALTPSYFYYSIHDIQTDTILKVKTTVVPSSNIHDLIIAETAILNDLLPHELKCVNIEWYLGTTRMGTAEYVYRVINLRKVPIAT